MPTKPVVAGIVRVSNKDQGEGQSPENQRQTLSAAGATEFFEAVESGFKEQRRQSLEPVFQAIRSGRISKLLATDLSRAARKDKVLDELIKACDEHGVEFLCGGMTMSHDSPYAWFSAKQMQLQAELYSRDLQGRILRGQEACRQRGVFGFTSQHLPWHLQKHPDDPRKVIAIADRWDDAKQAAMDYATGRVPLRAICQRLYEKHGVMGASSSLTKWLRSGWIRGHYASRDTGKILIANVAPALLTEAEAQALNERLVANRKRMGTRAPHQIRALSGLCRCVHCERLMTTATNIRSLSYMRCANPQCEAGTVGMRVDQIELVLRSNDHRLSVYAAQVLAQRNVATKPTKELLNLREQVRKLDEALAIVQNAAIEKERDDLKRRIAGLEEGHRPPDQAMFNIREILNIGSEGWWESKDEATRNTIYRLVMEECAIDTKTKKVLAIKWRDLDIPELVPSEYSAEEWAEMQAKGAGRVSPEVVKLSTVS